MIMKKIEEVQIGKLVTAYGGTGSIIETLNNGSLRIKPFDEWPIYRNLFSKTPLNQKGQALLISEPRLVKRLVDIGYSKLKGVFSIPELDLKDEVYSPSGATLVNTISGEYFPKWFYCPHCRKFKPVDVWAEEWRNQISIKKNDKRINRPFYDNPPACAECTKALRSKTQRKNSIVFLEQTRFVLASLDSGEVIDVPWSALFNMPSGTKAWPIPSKIPNNDISFHTSSVTNDLYGLTVKLNQQSISLAEIQNKYFIYKDHAYRMVHRSANNVFFPYVISSIFIPFKGIDQAIIDTVKSLNNMGHSASFISSAIHGQLSSQQVSLLIRNNFDASIIEGKYSSEQEFRLEEFKYITDSANYNAGVCSNEDFISIITDKTPLPKRVKGLYCLKKLKETKALVAYTRVDEISPSDISEEYAQPAAGKKWYNVNKDEEDQNVRARVHPTCTIPRGDVYYMPAVTSYGEGFFVELDLSDIEDKALDNGQNKREVFLHTYCHLIMKELEFQCGYPLASLSERLYYIPDTNASRYGFMIYTISGEDGSFGGITSLFANGAGKIKKIFSCAIMRAKDCPNDPICEMEGGHCFACLDLPETACEEYNKKLSRIVFNDNI